MRQRISDRSLYTVEKHTARRCRHGFDRSLYGLAASHRRGSWLRPDQSFAASGGRLMARSPRSLAFLNSSSASTFVSKRITLIEKTNVHLLDVCRKYLSDVHVHLGSAKADDPPVAVNYF